MTQRVPQVIVSLSPQGGLVMELPGAMSLRRKIEVKDLATLQRVLMAQLADQTEIGEDGGPTRAQVLHWERHAEWAQASCRFCIAEGRAKPDYGALRKRAKPLVLDRSDGVQVRRVPERVKGKAGPQVARAKIEGTGL